MRTDILPSDTCSMSLLSIYTTVIIYIVEKLTNLMQVAILLSRSSSASVILYRYYTVNHSNWHCLIFHVEERHTWLLYFQVSSWHLSPATYNLIYTFSVRSAAGVRDGVRATLTNWPGSSVAGRLLKPNGSKHEPTQLLTSVKPLCLRGVVLFVPQPLRDVWILHTLSFRDGFVYPFHNGPVGWLRVTF